MLRWIVAMLLLAPGVWASASVQRGCAPTVQAAVDGLLANARSEGRNGFRVEDVRVDRVRGRAWAIVADCGDASRPHTAVVLPRVDAKWLDQPAAVHAGDHVTVVAGGESRMELTGITEESAAVGGEVRVRLDRGILGDAEDVARLRARVVKQGVVEIVR